MVFVSSIFGSIKRTTLKSFALSIDDETYKIAKWGMVMLQTVSNREEETLHSDLPLLIVYTNVSSSRFPERLVVNSLPIFLLG